MTSLIATTLVLPAAGLGPENPLPPLVKPAPVQQVANLAELPADLAEGLSYGRLDTVLPYRLQDGYRRERTETELPALVLENDRLRATVLPSLGGRLYSLWHKPSGRELLYRNPVVQPANLALRDAWFAGGVEWNLGSTGHTAQTCAPMFAARIEGPDGTPVLRLWEWERTRDLPYQLDFSLPEDSDFLLVGVRVRNPHAHPVPVYWWSNIAVTQEAGTRVVAPATEAWHYGYGGRLDRVTVPGELTYPARAEAAADYFFELPEESPRWIAAVDEHGDGLLQSSTRRLRGRKLFVWGESAGGRRWQEWLAPGAPGYLEIQAGLARTQLEHLRLDAGQSWDWLEAYGPVSADPAVVHGDDWAAATASVQAGVPSLEQRHRDWLTVADRQPESLLHQGSGWGALEVHRTMAVLPGTRSRPPRWDRSRSRGAPCWTGSRPRERLRRCRRRRWSARLGRICWSTRRRAGSPGTTAAWPAGPAASTTAPGRPGVRRSRRRKTRGRCGISRWRRTPARRRSCTGAQWSWLRTCCRWSSKRFRRSSKLRSRNARRCCWRAGAARPPGGCSCSPRAPGWRWATRRGRRRCSRRASRCPTSGRARRRFPTPGPR